MTTNEENAVTLWGSSPTGAVSVAISRTPCASAAPRSAIASSSEATRRLACAMRDLPFAGPSPIAPPAHVPPPPAGLRRRRRCVPGRYHYETTLAFSAGLTERHRWPHDLLW